MSKLTIALGSLMGGTGKEYCPDCGCDLKSNGSCPECGYGEEMDEEEKGDEGKHMQAMMDLRDDLQRIVEKLGRLIAKD